MQKFCFLLLFLTVTTSNGTSLMISPVNCATNNTACSVSQDNLLSTFGDVSSLLECRQLCYDTENCSFITYYGQESFPFSKVCMLLKSCEETSPCEGCVSETRNCFKKCGFTYTGKLDDNTFNQGSWDHFFLATGVSQDPRLANTIWRVGSL